MHEIWSLTASPDTRPPDGLDPALVRGQGTTIETVELYQNADGMIGYRIAPPSRTGENQAVRHLQPHSLIALIRTENRLIKVESLDDAGFWPRGEPLSGLLIGERTNTARGAHFASVA